MINIDRLVEEIEGLVIPIQEKAKRRGMKMLVIGKTNVGKTRFSLTAEDPILFIDTEFAVSTYKDLVKDKQVDVIDLLFIDEETKEVDSVKTIEVLDKIAGKLLTDWKNKYKTVVIDSGTTLWKVYQDWLRYEVVREGGRLNKKGVPVDRRDWGKANSKYEGLLSLLIASDMNVILTIQEQPEYDGLGNMIGYKPVMQKRTQYFFDIHLRLDKDLLKNPPEFYGEVVNFRFNPAFEGKKMLNPTFDKIKKLIE